MTALLIYRRMRCAGESWGSEPKDGDWLNEYPFRTFTRSDGDWVCTHCGWLQSSFESGVAELCHAATWHDADAYVAHAAIARAAGFDVPRLPPHQEV